MKKTIINIFCLLIGIIIGLNLFNPCDVNRDGKVTTIDYVKVKNYIMKRNDLK